MISGPILIILGTLILALVVIFGKSRFATVARNRATEVGDAAADLLSNPVNDGIAEIREAKRDASKIQSEIAELNASTAELEQQRGEADADVQKYERIAVVAGKAGNAGDVKAALAAKAKAQATSEELTQTISLNNELKAALETQYGELLSDIEDAERSQVSDAIRIKNAQRREAAAKRVAGLTGGERFASAKALKTTASKAEAKAAAWETTAKGAPKAQLASLEDRYAGTGGVSDEDVAKYLGTSA